MPQLISCCKIKNLNEQITLNIDMTQAPDGYNLPTDTYEVTLNSDGKTGSLSTSAKANLTIVSDYYAVLRFEMSSGATLPGIGQ